MAETLMFNALREALDEEMARDDKVMVLGEDVGHYGGSYSAARSAII
jgi:pyruvate dehydrogenase E1 component beta subunit